MGLSFPSSKTIRQCAVAYVYPAIDLEYTRQEASVIGQLSKKKGLQLCGDACFASPGYCSKYGTYSLMDYDSRKVVAFSLLQCTEASSSPAMEKVGLRRSLTSLLSKELRIGVLCTDGNDSIRKLMAEEFPDIEHSLDMWHVAKRLKLALLKVSTKKATHDLKPWIRHITNHLWYAAQECEEEYSKLKDIWVSCLHHVQGVHVWPGGGRCHHGNLDPEELRETAWLDETGEAFIALEKVILNPRLLRNLERCTKFLFTSDLENFHSLNTKYNPKRIHFGFLGVEKRTKLAVMDHNENVDRAIAQTSNGQDRVSRVHSKATKTWRLKAKKVSKTHGFRKAIKERAVLLHQSWGGSTVLAATSVRKAAPRHLPKNIAKSQPPEVSLMREEYERKKRRRM